VVVVTRHSVGVRFIKIWGGDDVSAGVDTSIPGLLLLISLLLISLLLAAHAQWHYTAGKLGLHGLLHVLQRHHLGDH
jgi:hypothetical protein